MATEPKASVLVVDDEAPVRELLSSILRDDNYAVVAASSVDEAIEAFEGRDFDVVFTDLTMPKRNGLELLAYMKERQSAAASIVLTGYGSQETAVQAMRLGAFDYLTKPFSVKIILDAAKNALALKAAPAPSVQDAPAATGARPFLKDSDRKLVGKSAPMRALQALIEQVAPTSSTVLIRGESGTGKELVARALHRQSPRTNQPMIPVNCGAIPEDLLESELFGHVKGSFTGAIHDRVGRFVLANKGNHFSGRNRRHESETPGKSAACFAGAGTGTGRFDANHSGRRARDRSNQRQPGTGRGGKTLPRGFVLPPERGAD